MNERVQHSRRKLAMTATAALACGFAAAAAAPAGAATRTMPHIGIPGENSRSGVAKPVFPIKTTWWQAIDPREAGDGHGSFVEGST